MGLARETGVDKRKWRWGVSGKIASPTNNSGFYLLALPNFLCAFVFCLLVSRLSLSGHLLHFREQLNT